MNSNPAALFDLSGKVAVVTGAAQGLGEAIARALTHHGARTIMVDANAEGLAATAERISSESSSGLVESAVCDVTDRAQVDARINGVLGNHGRIDVLVNNAGIHRRASPLDFSERDIDDVLAVNVRGAFYMAGAVGRPMVEQRSGSIINLSALGGGVVGLGRGGSVYGMTKGAIVALTRDLAAEWGKYGVRVNAIAPGWMRTPMTAALQKDPVKSARVLERVPLGRWGEAGEVAGVAVFLACDASSYITGTTIPVDGGAANVISIAE